MDQKPSVGRIVHYQSYGTPAGEYKSQPVAATITQVEYQPVPGDRYNDAGPPEPTGRVGLCIFNPSGLFFKPLSDGGCAFSEEPKPGHWSWPPRV